MLLRTVERNDRRPRKDVLKRRLEQRNEFPLSEKILVTNENGTKENDNENPLYFFHESMRHPDSIAGIFVYPFIDVISISRVLHDRGISQKRRYIRFTYIIPRTDRLIRTRSRRLIIARFDVIIGFD